MSKISRDSDGDDEIEDVETKSGHKKWLLIFIVLGGIFLLGAIGAGIAAIVLTLLFRYKPHKLLLLRMIRKMLRNRLKRFSNSKKMTTITNILI
jgi:hypothetical protein